MNECKLHLVEDNELLINKGDALPVFNPSLGYSQLIIVCPGCGEISGSAKKHRWIPKTQSYTPSIVHDKDLGGCGWHGWLKNGVFKKV